MFACSAGGPGFDSRLRRLVAPPPPTLYAEDVGGPGQAPTVPYNSEVTVNTHTIVRYLRLFVRKANYKCMLREEDK